MLFVLFEMRGGGGADRILVALSGAASPSSPFRLVKCFFVSCGNDVAIRLPTSVCTSFTVPAQTTSTTLVTTVRVYVHMLYRCTVLYTAGFLISSAGPRSASQHGLESVLTDGRLHTQPALAEPQVHFQLDLDVLRPRQSGGGSHVLVHERSWHRLTVIL